MWMPVHMPVEAQGGHQQTLSIGLPCSSMRQPLSGEPRELPDVISPDHQRGLGMPCL